MMTKRTDTGLMRMRKFVATLATVVLGVGIVAACGADANSSTAGLGCTSTLPAGSFSASCSGCSMSGSVLSCTACGDGSGATVAAHLDTCSCGSAAATQGISNSHGVLQCGSASSSSGEKCSPGSGECKNCKCGQSCFATAVCTSCTARCGYSCVTDQDCVDLQSKYNLTVGYTHCVKTSPGYEIYKCE